MIVSPALRLLSELTLSELQTLYVSVTGDPHTAELSAAALRLHLLDRKVFEGLVHADGALRPAQQQSTAFAPPEEHTMLRRVLPSLRHRRARGARRHPSQPPHHRMPRR